MAEAAERLLEGRGWLPPVLRTLEAAPDEPSSEAVATAAPGPAADEACNLAAA
ncbi:hypothetical protein D3C80_2148280 [compost metagenome]